MSDETLRDKTILVVEDDYFLASDIERALESAGALVIGPFSRTEQARQALTDNQPAAAILDINISGTLVYPLARELANSGIPFIFATGYDARAIPMEFAKVPQLVKPIEQRQLLNLVASVTAK